MTVTESTPAPAKAERWTAQWKELYAEVITTGLCTGCAGCVVTCPHDVIGYEHEEGKYKPFHLEEELGLDNCIHGEKGCTHVHPGVPAVPGVGARGRHAPVRPRPRARRDVRHLAPAPADAGRATTDVHKIGQDGGFVSAMLIWAHGRTTTSRPRWSVGRRGRRRLEGQARLGPQPGRGPRHRRQPLHVLRQPAGAARGQGRRASSQLALVGMGCQTSSPPVMWDRKAGKVVQAVPVQHRPAVLQDVRRRHLPRAVRGQVRPEEGRTW